MAFSTMVPLPACRGFLLLLSFPGRTEDPTLPLIIFHPPPQEPLGAGKATAVLFPRRIRHCIVRLKSLKARVNIHSALLISFTLIRCNTTLLVYSIITHYSHYRLRHGSLSDTSKKDQRYISPLQGDWAAPLSSGRHGAPHTPSSAPAPPPAG